MNRRRVAIVLAVVAAVLVLAELGARALAPYLPEPDLYTDDTTTVKVHQLDRLDCVDVVFAGNSMTRDGLDPAVFGDESSLVAYNAALDAATPALLARWVPEEVDPRVHPDGVVVGLSSFDLNDEASIGATALEAYDAAPMTRDDWSGRLQKPFLRNLDLFRYRNAIRDPEVLWDGITAWRHGERQPRLGAEGIDGVLGPDGKGLSRRDLAYTPSPVTERFVTGELLNDFHLGGAQADATDDLLADLAGRGIDTAVVVLPVTDDYIDLHPGGREQFDDFLDLAERLAEANGARFLDLHDLAPDDSWFADTHHLNGTGADALSQELATRLDDDFATGPRCQP